MTKKFGVVLRQEVSLTWEGVNVVVENITILLHFLTAN